MDLNLVRVFVSVFETRSLTLSSQRLHVTQSAVSQSLRRLRETLDDPLFERAGGEMRPTALAEAIADDFREALAKIDGVVESTHGFSASTSDRRFRIALSELGEIGWLPEIFERVHKEAPRVEIEVVALAPAQVSEWLSRGIVDLAISPAELSGAFERRVVKREGYSVVMSTINRWAALPLTTETYAALPHAAVTSDSGAPLIDVARERAGITVTPIVTVQHFAALPRLITESTELVATIPEAIARGWATTWPLAVHPVPFEMAPIELRLYRRSATHHTGAIDWLFATVARALEGTPAEFSTIHAEQEPDARSPGW
ncbi:LysR family transcriptional regulator [Microbacterium sp. B2969]|uniref:LysR family transcriptional regulator n=1 Tax=Microbacterium alkaliflavum TaxID=3248839 RepID=A0ABW7QER1_9MICO